VSALLRQAFALPDLESIKGRWQQVAAPLR
jgi:hypothetical protein